MSTLMFSRRLALGARQPRRGAPLLSAQPTAASAVPIFAAKSRTFAYNVWQEASSEKSSFTGSPREIAQAIFQQHANVGSVLTPGAAFKGACHSLAQEFPEMGALENVALEGRVFEIMDLTGRGTLSMEEFINGVEEMLQPTQKKYSNLKERLQAGRVATAQEVSTVKRIAIIGGGVAGLQTARALSRIGKEVVIFEKGSNIGGVWRQNYADFGLQVPRELYEFPEYPYPTSAQWEKFPPGEQVQKYIESYADHFGLQKLIRFDTGVSELKSETSDGKQRWKVVFSKKGEAAQEEDFDFVVVATGMYSSVPHMPSIRGRGDFKGEVHHSSTFTDKSAAAGKKVVVIGGGKSAIDIAVAASDVASSSTLLFREAHWPVPRKLCDLVPFKWGTYSRFGHFMLPIHHNVSNLAWYMHSVLTPVKWVWWRVVELMFRVQFRLSGDLVPSTPIEIDVFTGGQILNYDFRDRLKEGKVKAVKGAIEKFVPDGIILQDGSKMACDMVVFGTGFGKTYDLLDRLLQNRLQKHKDGLYLYRNILAPRLPDIAFIGAEVSTFNNILTHALQAEWLARMLDGKIQCPEPGQMMRQIEVEQAWKRSWMPGTSARASILQLHMMKYHDQLCKDMGENNRRKGMNVLAEVFAPYCAADYAPLFAAKP